MRGIAEVTLLLRDTEWAAGSGTEIILFLNFDISSSFVSTGPIYAQMMHILRSFQTKCAMLTVWVVYI